MDPSLAGNVELTQEEIDAACQDELRTAQNAPGDNTESQAQSSAAASSENNPYGSSDHNPFAGLG